MVLITLIFRQLLDMQLLVLLLYMTIQAHFMEVGSFAVTDINHASFSLIAMVYACTKFKMFILE